MDPAGYNLTSPYTSGYRDDYSRTTAETNDTTIVFIIYKSSTFLTFAATLYSIIFILGIIGNGLVIWIAGFRMKTISSVWFLHLAIADFLCCASLLVFIVALASCDLCFLTFPSAIFYLINSILLYLSMSVSVLLLTAMSVDRWVSVMWPFWAQVYRTQKLARIIVGIIWVLSFLWTGVMIYLLIIRGYHNIGELAMVMMTLNVTNSVILFVIPFLIIFTSYVTIFLKLRKSKRPQRSQRPYRIITAVILCFFICWAPYNVWATIPLNLRLNVLFLSVEIIITGLACLNSCINPIIYVIRGEDFRHRFLRSIPFRIQSALDENPDDPCEEQEDPQPTCTLEI